jgi:hypothetical protein
MDSRGALTTISPPYVTMPHFSILPSQNLYPSGYPAHTNEPVAARRVAGGHFLICPKGYPVSHNPTPYEPHLETLRRPVAPLKLLKNSRWDGEPNLRQALVGETNVVDGEGSGSDTNLDDLALTSGCNLAFVAVLMAIADPGDDAILPVSW